MMKLVRPSDQVVVVASLKLAESFFDRLRGLIGVRSYPEGQGLLFSHCNNIHMWMMSIPIDVVFLRQEHTHPVRTWAISSVHRGLRPWKIFPVADFKAKDVLELPVGTIDRLNLQKGDVVCIAS